MMALLRKTSTKVARVAVAATLAAALAIGAPTARAQTAQPPGPDPVESLASALSAACKQDRAAFATHLTAESAATFRGLPEAQQVALLKRFILLDDPGKPLLSTSAQGRTEVRCEAAGLVADMHFGQADIRENLAFVAVQIGQPGSQDPRSVRIGFVREGGQWKLLSVGLLLLDLPSVAEQWSRQDLEVTEDAAIDNLRKIASALDKYQRAFGKLPETLDQLGPAPSDGASPEHAGLLDDASFAAGSAGGYSFRYVILPVAAAGDDSDRDKAAGFALAATPNEYGKSGRRSLYLDSSGVLRGGDKRGEVATVDDPLVTDTQEPHP